MEDAAAKQQQWSGEDLADARQAAELTQEDLARLLGVKRQRVAAIEGSRRVTPRAARRVIAAIVALAEERAR